MPAPKKSHWRRNAVILFAIVFFSVGAVVSTPPILFFNVTVSGTANVAKVSGAVPTGVTFVDENGAANVATIGASGTYSISLQNGHTFSVFIDYALAHGSGNCTAGSLVLYTLGWTQALNTSC